jgi:hypothetical protein
VSRGRQCRGDGSVAGTAVSRGRQCRGDGSVAAQLGSEPAQGVQAAPVAAVAQVGVQLLGAADPIVPALLQVCLVRAEQARPGQAGAADQPISGHCRGVRSRPKPVIPPGVVRESAGLDAGEGMRDGRVRE